MVQSNHEYCCFSSISSLPCQPQSTNIDVEVGMYRKLFLESDFLEYISQYKLMALYKISDSELNLNVFRKSEVT